ncbi:hypothetical protein, variant 3 [Capsaspora owczarzaki ATCC 30864]|uniref:K Homology domain-containing protein n=1 Tax=Capsaspora owczarzaki (strain ATCC 30864) TaxID=595528 RepID=A0A0D2WY58_CAPO3|nr:hypothetical protein, variant 2 [Capsaspora owczarzaki ATCC 30864]KJE97803.1 hypothetical protein, variant 3 [Capsaspora owczarzaki ATCC 30864]
MSDFNAVPPPASSGAAVFEEAMRRARDLAAKLGAPGAGAAPSDAYAAPPSSEPSMFKRSHEESEGAGQDGGDANGASKRAALTDPVSDYPQPGQSAPATDAFSVPSHTIGLIIGRQGETIRRIESQTGVRVQCAQDGGSNDRVVTISGPAEGIELAKSMIREIIFKDDRVASAHGAGHGGSHGGPHGGSHGGAAPWATGANTMPVSGGGAEPFIMMIPTSRVGLVIGRSGDKIREIEARTGARLQMIQHGLPRDATEKPLHITGTQTVIEAAKLLVEEAIRPLDQAGAGFGGSAAVGGTTLDVQVPREFTGAVLGERGDTIKRLQHDTGTRIQFRSGDDGAAIRTLQVTGEESATRRAEAAIQVIIEEARNRRPGSRVEYSGGGGSGSFGSASFSGSGSGGYSARSGHTNIQVAVPARITGLVIGKSGENVKYMEQATGARIQLNKDAPPNAVEKFFNVSGEAAAVEAAQNMLRERINSLQSERGGSGGSSAPGGAAGAYGQQYPGYQNYDWSAYYAQAQAYAGYPANYDWSAYYAQQQQAPGAGAPPAGGSAPSK